MSSFLFHLYALEPVRYLSSILCFQTSHLKSQHRMVTLFHACNLLRLLLSSKIFAAIVAVTQRRKSLVQDRHDVDHRFTSKVIIAMATTAIVVATGTTVTVVTQVGKSISTSPARCMCVLTRKSSILLLLHTAATTTVDEDCKGKCGLITAFTADGNGNCDNANNNCGCNWDNGDCCRENNGNQHQYGY